MRSGVNYYFIYDVGPVAMTSWVPRLEASLEGWSDHTTVRALALHAANLNLSPGIPCSTKQLPGVIFERRARCDPKTHQERLSVSVFSSNGHPVPSTVPVEIWGPVAIFSSVVHVPGKSPQHGVAHTHPAVCCRKNAVELELAKCKLDMLSLNSQLLEAIQQKLNLSQQLEAWQVSEPHSHR